MSLQVNTMSEIGRVVKYHRKRAGLSRKKMAELSGVGKTLIYDIEHGKETVQFEGLHAVLHALNIAIRLDGPFTDSYYRERDQEDNQRDNEQETENDR